jgi:hypothetical protein
MRPALAAIGLLFVSVIIATADEPRVPPVDDSAVNRYLLERIAQLERRVAQLEARLARPYTPAPQTYAPGQPHRDVPSAPYDISDSSEWRGDPPHPIGPSARQLATI